MRGAGMLGWFVVGACTRPAVTPPLPTLPTTVTTTSGPLAIVGEVAVEAPASGSVRLVRRIVVSTNRPTRASLVVRGDDGLAARKLTFDAEARDHDLPLLGLRNQVTYDVALTLTADDGEAVTASVDVDPGQVQPRVPALEVLVSEPARMEPGYTVFPAETDGPTFLVAVDATGEVVWTYDPEVPTVRALGFANGAFTMLVGAAVRRVDPLGEILDRWGAGGGEAQIAIAHPVHHEVAFEADGSFWALYKDLREVDDYPTTDQDPFTTAPASIDDDRVAHYAADGALLSDWSMADRLDPTRIGFGSLDLNDEGYDWAHANAIVPRLDLGLVLVSLRHQDAVVALDPNGDLQWILGNHDGWPPELAPYLLEPVGAPFAWQYHQHGPMIGPEGRIALFDNGNDQRTTPYSRDPQPGLYSRVAEFEVDPVARTVRQTFESAADDHGLYSQALGNADVQPTTGNILATYAFLHEEEGVKNLDLGRGDRSLRLIEVDRVSGDIVFDLRAYVDVDDSPLGLLADRAIRVPTLYGPGVTEEIVP